MISLCTTGRRMIGALIIGLVFIGSADAAGPAYRFEMIIFERPGGAIEPLPQSAEPAPDRRIVGRLDSLAAGSKTLGPVAYTLKQKGLIVHKHLSWAQVPSGLERNAWYQLDGGRIGGLIRLTRGRFLHIDADLVIRDSGTRARLYRRMRSGELHYLDHPRLGILIKATRLARRSAAGADNDKLGEPKPVRPGAT